MNAFTQRLAVVAAMAARGLRRTTLRPVEAPTLPLFDDRQRLERQLDVARSRGDLLAIATLETRLRR